MKGWEKEILDCYPRRGKFFFWVNEDDAWLDFSYSVLPAFEEIKIKLEPLFRRISITKNNNEHTFSATLSFEEKDVGKSAFQVEAELYNSYIHISTYDGKSDRSYFLRLDSDRFLTKKLIISEFITFLNARSEVIRQNPPII
ncbi:hypothetical protein [Pseudoalteromonas sp.]|uniref:hypothetical protein n=1 Tax=Pseudoalteromonas sp. TaxID=53249 RepID=UPI00300162E6